MPSVTSGGGGMGNQIKKFISALRLHPESKSHMSYFGNIFKDKTLCQLDSKQQYTPLNTWRIVTLPSDSEIPVGFCKFSTSDKGFHNCDVNGRNIDHEYLRIPHSFRKKIINLIQNRLQYSNEEVIWKKDTRSPARKYERVGGALFSAGQKLQEGHASFEWEDEAYKND